MAVYPAYWRRGYGEELTNWGLALAKDNGLGQILVANWMGEKLYLKVGFERVGSVALQPNDEEDVENGRYKGVELGILVYRLDDHKAKDI